jgi:GNAT superfamily N-acetyltransferase
MSQIEIKKVSSKKDLTLFIKFPWQIYKNDPTWVPPLIMDRKKLLDKSHNPFYKHAEMELFLALKNGQLVGRIAAITNENHNKFHEDNMGFFGFFESIDDVEVAGALFEAVKSWLKHKGKEGMYGPINPSTNDELGLLIEGFDTPPYVMMCHNPPFYQSLCENNGLIKAKDIYAWHLDLRTNNISDKMYRVAAKAAKRAGITIRTLSIKKIKQELELVREVYNNAWSKNWGFVPMTPEEIQHTADDLKQIANEELLLLAEKDGRPIGFSVSVPNINEILIKIPNGKLLPTGIFKLLTGLKKVKTARTLILGFIKEYQHSGLGSIFYLESIRRAKEIGIIGGEMSWILEDNHAMNSAIEALGSKKYKTYRIFEQNF